MKKRLFGYFLDTFGDARRRYEDLKQDPGEVDRILAAGAERTREVVTPLMDQLRRLTGLR